MNRIKTFAFVVCASLACSGESPRSEDTSVLVAASAEPAPGLPATLTTALAASPPARPGWPTVLLEQDTARTVTRRVWVDADLESVSPDGRFASLTDWDTGDLAIRDLGTGDIRRLTRNRAPFDPGTVEASRISPDGRHVAYSWYDAARPNEYKLGIVDMEGSNPRQIHEDPDTDWIDPHDWSPDSRFVLVEREVASRREILLVSAEDGSVRLLKTLETNAPLTMSFSPDGRYIAYDYPQKEDSQDRDILVLPVAGGSEHALIQHPANDILLGWAPDGDHLLFASDRSGTPGAWLLPVSDGEASGSPWLVKPDMWRAAPVGFTRDGRYFYSVRTGRGDAYIANFDPEAGTIIGSPTAVTSRSLGDSDSPNWSPDGRHLVYITERGPAGAMMTGAASRVVVIRSLETGEVRELNLRISGMPTEAHWTSDGRTLVVTGWNPFDAEERVKRYLVDVQTGQMRICGRQADSAACRRGQVSPDGRALFYWTATENQAGQRALRIVREELATRDTASLFETRYGSSPRIGHMALSPDGEMLAFGYWPDGGSARLVLLPATGGEPRELAAHVRGLAWMPDGQALLIQQLLEDASEKPTWEIWYVDVREETLERIGLTMRGVRFGLDIHPDGRRIAFSAGIGGSELWVMENFLPTEGDS